jgi:hypothetical protein
MASQHCSGFFYCKFATDTTHDIQTHTQNKKNTWETEICHKQKKERKEDPTSSSVVNNLQLAHFHLKHIISGLKQFSI